MSEYDPREDPDANGNKAVIPFAGTDVAVYEDGEEPEAEQDAPETDGEPAVFTTEDATRVCLDIAAKIEADPDAYGHPNAWSESAKFEIASTPAAIANELILRLPRFEPLRRQSIEYMFREKDWTAGGKLVMGQMKKLTGLLKLYAAFDWIAFFSWSTWCEMSSWQKVALVYHELRHGISSHDFEGYFDELELFGMDTYKSWARLREAAATGVRTAERLAEQLELIPSDELMDGLEE